MPSEKLRNLVRALALSLAVFAMTPASAALSPEDETTIKDVRKETSDLLHSIQSYTAEQRDEALQEIEIAVLRLDNRIDALQAGLDERWDSMTRPARQQARETLKALQRQRIELAEWYGNLKGSSASAWKEIRQGFSRAYQDINKAWEKALQDFNAAES